MKNKITEKIFNIVYTDSLTETYNRTSYDDRLKKLRKPRAILDNITLAVICVDSVKELKDSFGQHTADEAIKSVADTLKKTLGEQADIFRINDDTFVCIADKNILSYVSQFMDYMSFENRDRTIKINTSVGYGMFDKKHHKTIDDLIRHCEKKMSKAKK